MYCFDIFQRLLLYFLRQTLKLTKLTLMDSNSLFIFEQVAKTFQVRRRFVGSYSAFFRFLYFLHGKNQVLLTLLFLSLLLENDGIDIFSRSPYSVTLNWKYDNETADFVVNVSSKSVCLQFFRKCPTLKVPKTSKDTGYGVRFENFPDILTTAANVKKA